MQFGSDQRIHLGHVTAQPEQPTGHSSQNQDALDNAEMGKDEIKNVDAKIEFTHPLFGPLGATIGKTMPTTPQRTVKMRNGTNEAPIVRYSRRTKYELS